MTWLLLLWGFEWEETEYIGTFKLLVGDLAKSSWLAEPRQRGEKQKTERPKRLLSKSYSSSSWTVQQTTMSQMNRSGRRSRNSNMPSELKLKIPQFRRKAIIYEMYETAEGMQRVLDTFWRRKSGFATSLKYFGCCRISRNIAISSSCVRLRNLLWYGWV